MNLEETSEKVEEIDLFSLEKLDRSSPDSWSQTLNGLNEYASLLKTPKQSNIINTPGNTSKWMSDLNKEDLDLLNELATLSTSQLMDKVKELIDLAYQLGLEESNQMTRGKLLNILDAKVEN